VNVVALCLWIAAAALFLVAGLVPPYFGRLVSWGLALFVVGDIIQWGAKSHSIHF